MLLLVMMLLFEEPVIPFEADDTIVDPGPGQEPEPPPALLPLLLLLLLLPLQLLTPFTADEALDPNPEVVDEEDERREVMIFLSTTLLLDLVAAYQMLQPQTRKKKKVMMRSRERQLNKKVCLCENTSRLDTRLTDDTTKWKGRGDETQVEAGGEQMSHTHWKYVCARDDEDDDEL